jgi:hypothetical protein
LPTTHNVDLFCQNNIIDLTLNVIFKVILNFLYLIHYLDSFFGGNISPSSWDLLHLWHLCSYLVKFEKKLVQMFRSFDLLTYIIVENCYDVISWNFQVFLQKLKVLLLKVDISDSFIHFSSLHFISTFHHFSSVELYF